MSGHQTGILPSNGHDWDLVLASPAVDAAGTWHGAYEYEPQDGASSVAFAMHLAQDERGRVFGTVTDGPGGMPEEGRIIGTCRRGRLQFLKLMPVARIGADDGTQEVAAMLAADGHEVDGPLEHPQILYEGRLTPDGRTMAGTWRLDDYAVPLKGGQSARINGARGVWSATRADR
jgi:hypothetical protein